MTNPSENNSKNNSKSPVDNFPYQDILYLSPPVIPNRPHLSAAQRAAQVAPYKTITQFHDSTDQLEADSDQPETEIIFDNIQSEIDEDLYFDIFPEEDIFPENKNDNLAES